jgi:hypothetical protein
MSARYGEYGPDLVKLMSEALDAAWDKVRLEPKDAELARLIMAGAIIEQVDAGVRRRDQLVAYATSVLAAAATLSAGHGQSKVRRAALTVSPPPTHRPPAG